MSIEKADAQSLYMPADIKKAYANGTRSADGNPGKNYWQNKATYNIQLAVNPPERTIRGVEEIVYTNNSPDTLRELVLKLFLNIHKPGAPRESKAYENDLTAGVQLDDLKINGVSYELSNDKTFTNYFIEPGAPILPGKSVKLNIGWHFDIASSMGREGMADKSSYFLAYFYPRIAVYDDYNGWDDHDFTDGHEFYSDFNDYTVTINAPRNFVVWGTGTLQRPETLLQPEFTARYKKSFTSDTVIHIATADEMKARRVTSQEAVNSWTFKASDIPDMAFAISDHYAWDAWSVEVDEKSKRRTSVQSAYKPESADFHKMALDAGLSIRWFSKEWPGIAFPYEKMTVFNGDDGMEFPMMANDGSFDEQNFARNVAAHEIAHMYMPFYMGINETRFGFMDEGWATALELLSGYDYMTKTYAEEMFTENRVFKWIKDRSGDMDIPIITPGTSLTGKALKVNQYGKPALAYLALKDLMGDAAFKTSLHAYMDRWHGKHPTPWDFFHTFNNTYNKPLDWFWNNWFFSPNYMDIGIGSVSKNPHANMVRVRNIGGMAVPFDVNVTYMDGTKETIHCTPSVWERDTRNAIVLINYNKRAQSVTIGHPVFLDANTADNSYEAPKQPKK
ncbi:M1 family metallopeptidase [Pseudoflavitalea sp. G-6-1-2]|nr:M1 family metallopeptidase [Pseudoflavitalea sp. G-6-1-2]